MNLPNTEQRNLLHPPVSALTDDPSLLISANDCSPNRRFAHTCAARMVLSSKQLSRINSNGVIGAKYGKARTLSCQTLIFLEHSQMTNLFSVFEQQQNTLYNMSHN